MFSHRHAFARRGAIAATTVLLLAGLVMTSQHASAQSSTDHMDSLEAVIAQLGATSAETGEPITVVLAGATSRHTLEIVGAIATAVGERGSPSGWRVVLDEGDAGQDGPLIIVADGPGASEVTVMDDDRPALSLAGDPTALTEQARNLVAASSPIRTSVAVPDDWRVDDLAEALGVISHLAAGAGATTMHLVIDQIADSRHDLIVVGPDAGTRASALAARDGQPTLLAFAEGSPEVVAIAGPTPLEIPAPSRPLVLPAVAAFVVLAALGVDFARRRLEAELVPVAA